MSSIALTRRRVPLGILSHETNAIQFLLRVSTFVTPNKVKEVGEQASEREINRPIVFEGMKG